MGGRADGAGLEQEPRIQQTPWPSRIAIAGVTLAALALLSNAAADTPLSLGPGLNVIEWAADPAHGAWLVLLILGIRVAAVMATYGGGGLGGLIVPLVVIGALTGRVASGAFGVDDTGLLVVVGMAAFLGAGYRTPLAALMFVAETTGRPAAMYSMNLSGLQWRIHSVRRHGSRQTSKEAASSGMRS